MGSKRKAFRLNHESFQFSSQIQWHSDSQHDTKGCYRRGKNAVGADGFSEMLATVPVFEVRFNEILAMEDWSRGLRIKKDIFLDLIF